jgi:hypothetical protein
MNSELRQDCQSEPPIWFWASEVIDGANRRKRVSCVVHNAVSTVQKRQGSGHSARRSTVSEGRGRTPGDGLQGGDRRGDPVKTRWVEPDQPIQPGNGGLCGRTVGGQRGQRPAQPFFADLGSFPLRIDAHQMKVTSSFPSTMGKGASAMKTELPTAAADLRTSSG